ncbi:MAG: glycosyltransferase, partial [Anaerolineales bacterium]
IEHNFQRVEIWRGGVDIELYNPAKRSEEMRKRLSDGEIDRPLMLYVGRVSPEKKIDRLYPIMKAHPEVRLAIIGDGPSRADLETQFADTDTVFTGYLKGEELATAYASGDIFTFTGDKETFGNVVVEAMASGLPAIAPNSGGVTDLVKDGINGFLYDPTIPESIINAVEPLIKDGNLRREFGQRGREMAEQRTWEITLNELLENYKKVIEKGQVEGGYRWLIWQRESFVDGISEWRDRLTK